MKPSVLVTCGEERSALAVVRSLGRSGHAPLVCSETGRSLAGASRYAVREARVPSPLRDPADFTREVRGLTQRWRADVLLPMTDAALLAILPERDAFRGVRIPFPEIETFRRISDKREVLEVARELGIRVPRQRALAAPPSGVEELALDVPLPLVIKPARSVVGDREGGRRQLRVRHVSRPDELRGAIGELPPASYPLLLQEHVAGPGVGVFLLVRDGELLARFAHRRIREKPPAGGVSVYRESIVAPPELVDLSRALLEAFRWEGVAMVEYKLDSSTGTPVLMEVNGRFWGSLQLAVDAGVDFPTLLVRACLGDETPAENGYRSGVRCRWWWGDVDHLLARIRARGDAPPASGTSEGRWRALGEFLKLWRPGDRSEVLRLDDPAPFLRETGKWIAETGSALRGRLR